MDNSIPQNSIELYYPPAALTYIYPPGDVAKRDGITGNPKLEWMSRRSPANTHTVNRFGVVQHGTPQLTEINSGHPDLGVQR
jgi:hypothetical protein